MNTLQAGLLTYFVCIWSFRLCRSSKCNLLVRFWALWAGARAHTHTHTHTHFSLGNSVSRADCAFNVLLTNMSRYLATVKMHFTTIELILMLSLGFSEERTWKGKRNAAIMIWSQNRNKKRKLAATGLKCKQMFECLFLFYLVLSSIVIKRLSCCVCWSSSPWARSCFWIANSKNASDKCFNMNLYKNSWWL